MGLLLEPTRSKLKAPNCDRMERRAQKGSATQAGEPQMPEGCYSTDKPNPNLRAFVEAHLQEWPLDPETDKYGIPDFDQAIEILIGYD